MNIREEKNWPPIYFDPTWEECQDLIERGFDTLRIGIYTEKGVDYLVVASGHGATHNTIAQHLGRLNPRRKQSMDGERYEFINSLIIFEHKGRLLLTDGCQEDDDACKELAKQFSQFNGPALRAVKDIDKLWKEKQSIAV